MTGKELIRATYAHESTPRAPWVPYTGVHAGKLKGYTAKEVLTDADKLYESLMEVHRLYMPDGMPIVFHECGAIPTAEQMAQADAPWVMFMVWHTSHLTDGN